MTACRPLMVAFVMIASCGVSDPIYDTARTDARLTAEATPQDFLLGIIEHFQIEYQPNLETKSTVRSPLVAPGRLLEANSQKWVLVSDNPLTKLGSEISPSGNDPMILHGNGDTTIAVSASGMRDETATECLGVLVYSSAGQVARVIRQATEVGVEDLVFVKDKPATPMWAQDVDLMRGVSGLRVVDSTIEFLDDSGNPQLRMARPWLLDSAGRRFDAQAKIEGCKYDQDARAPWGRATIDPGARSCRISVTWDDASITYPIVLDPTWLATGSMGTARHDFASVGVKIGWTGGEYVLATGGYSAGGAVTSSAELYNSLTQTWATTGAMAYPRAEHAAVTIRDGRALITGGSTAPSPGIVTSTAEFYSPNTGLWSAAPSLLWARKEHTASVVPTGEIIIAGGEQNQFANVLTATDVYTANAASISAGPALHVPRSYHTATLALIGGETRLLIAGGFDGVGATGTTEYYVPTPTPRWTTGASMTPRYMHAAHALVTGAVVVAGGSDNPATPHYLSSVQVFTGTWANASPLTTYSGSGRTQLAAARTPEGDILFIGGVAYVSGVNYPTTLVDRFIGTTASTVVASTSLAVPRFGHQAITLRNGPVLTFGGYNTSSAYQYSAERDRKAGHGSCTTNSDCVSGRCVSSQCGGEQPSPACNSWITVPYRYDSQRFPWIYNANVLERQTTNFLDFQWQFWPTNNALDLQFVFEKGSSSTGYPTLKATVPGFQLENSWDYLYLSSASSMTLTGNLDQNHTVEYTTATLNLATGTNRYVNARLYTDSSVTNYGFRTKAVRIRCDGTTQLNQASPWTSRLHANQQRDGVLLGAGDIRYFSTLQPPNVELILHLKPDEAGLDHADLDLYASAASSTPGPNEFDWLSHRSFGSTSMAEEVIRVPPSPSARNIYFSAYQSTEGRSGYRIWDNVVGAVLSLRVGTEQNIYSTGQSAILSRSLQRIGQGVYQSFDGLTRISRWDVYNVSSPANCDGNYNACHYFMWSSAYCAANFGTANATCSVATCTPSGSQQINDCSWFNDLDNEGAIEAHELGHCRYGVFDEYAVSSGDYYCGHGIMDNQMLSNNLSDFCTAANHLQDPRNLSSGGSDPQSNWAKANACVPTQFANYYVSTTPDPEQWIGSDAFTDANSPILPVVVYH